MNFPLIYCNGDSYSNDHYHQSLIGNTYANFVAKQFTPSFVINSAQSGSCNRRIIRTTMHDMLQQRQLNPKQKIISLIGLSFELRSELWIDELTTNQHPQWMQPQESNFRTHTFSEQTNWRENLLAGEDINSQNSHRLNKSFFDKYSQGRAFFFSPYAERINLLCDLVMLRALLDSINVNFLVFQSPRSQKLQSEYLLDFFKKEIDTDRRFIDLENFGFCHWCHQRGFIPLDMIDRPEIAHYNVDAHESFANTILLPRLHELKIL